LKGKLDKITSWTAAGKPRYGDLLRTEKELHPNLWEALGTVSILAGNRKITQLVMPDSLEKRLREMGFSDQNIQDAAESVHENKTNKITDQDTAK